jgi:hypothetical protein
MKPWLTVAAAVVVAASVVGVVVACGTQSRLKRALGPRCPKTSTGPKGVTSPTGLYGPTGYSGNGDNGPTGATGAGPVGYTAAGLTREAACSSLPIYWAGPVAGDSYELTLRRWTLYHYVRYLPSGTDVGNSGRDFMTVATYAPFYLAFTAVKTAAGNKVVRGPHRSVIYVNPRDPRSVLVAFPDVHAEIEVYDPNPKVALETAKSGDIRPVG